MYSFCVINNFCKSFKKFFREDFITAYLKLITNIYLYIISNVVYVINTIFFMSEDFVSLLPIPNRPEIY